jgi:hypothetical protein
MHRSIPTTPVLLVALSSLALASPLAALASAADAWTAHRQEVVAACIRSSGLVDARLVGSVIEFNDSVGSSAALVAGRYPHVPMAGQEGLSLCLFDRRSRSAQAAPADNWR